MTAESKIICLRCGRWVRSRALHEPEVCQATIAAVVAGYRKLDEVHVAIWPKAPELAAIR